VSPSDLSKVDAFRVWFDALERRQLADLTLTEVRRALQALSVRYVERRGGRGAALDGAGKRAAFALFYGPLHYLIVRHVVDRLDAAEPAPARILDLGCGTGTSGAAWARATGGVSRLRGIDRNRWAVAEARWNWSRLGLGGTAHQGDLLRTATLDPSDALLLAYAVNELGAAQRETLRRHLLRAAARGARLLVVEPIARRLLPWWDEWCEPFLATGGRTDSWRFAADLPETLVTLDRAARMDHRELTARTLYVG
jgi:SAM-dependent methyltransferase